MTPQLWISSGSVYLLQGEKKGRCHPVIPTKVTAVYFTRTLNLIEKLGDPEPATPAIAPPGAMRIPRMFAS